MATLKDKGHILPPTPDLPRQMALAVSAWLDYNSSVCGEIGVQENMINHPIKAFSIMHQNEYEFEFEKQHPYLSPRCHVDMYMKFKEQEAECYFEFKQAKQETSDSNEKYRIFYDVARLSSLASQNKRCFFLIFGTGTSFKENFLEYRQDRERLNAKQRTIERHNGQEALNAPYYSRWFSVSEDGNKEKEIEIISDEHFEKFREKYLDDISVQDKEKAYPPNKILTRQIYLNSRKDSLNGVGLWEILRIP